MGEAKAGGLLEGIHLAVKRGFVGVAGFSCAVNLLMLTAPLYMLQVYDRVLTSRSGDTLLMLTMVAGLALLTLALLDGLRSIALVRVSGWLDGELAPPLLSSLLGSAVLQPGARSIQLLRDLGNFRQFLCGPGMAGLMDAPWVPIYLGVIFLLHPLLGGLATLGAVVLFGLALLNDRLTRKGIKDANTSNVQAMGLASAGLDNADAIEAMGMGPAFLSKWDAQRGKATAGQSSSSEVNARITATVKFMRLGLQVGILGVGALLVLRDQLTPGMMIAGSILMGRALAPVEVAVGSWRGMISAREAWNRVKQALASVDVEAPAMSLPAPEGGLTAEALVFGYPGSQAPTIPGVSFALAPGEIMGLIGPSAAGKTTLARLLVGNLAPQRGMARLGGIDLATWDAADKGPHIGYLSQDAELFAGTVADNIARLGEVKSEDVVAAAKLAGIHDMVLSLPDNYQTQIGSGGTVLSGGQRQRLGLARAVYGNPALVVLDEPNAGLDTAGEAELLATLRKLKTLGTTVVIISHRPAIVALADKIMVLVKGTVQHFGPPDEVLPKLTRPASAAFAEEDAP